MEALGESTQVTEYTKPIEIAALRSGESAKVMYWTQERLSFERPTLTHTAGAVPVKPLTYPVSLDTSNFLVGMVFLIGLMLLMLVLGYSLHPKAGATTQPATQPTTKT
jgi:hypothetical protein